MSIRVLRLTGALASLCLAVSLSGCGGGSSSPATPTPTPVPGDTGQISGQVLSAADASPVAGARVSAAAASAVSDSQGRFTLSGLAPATAVVLRIQADGHLDAVRPLPVTSNQATQVTQRLVAAGGAQTFSAATPGTLSLANSTASVDLPANGFVLDGSTTAATGTLTARLSVIDPARAPSAMPGRYVASTGRAIESFGAINVDLRDAAGKKVNLKAGSTATIRIPLASRSATPPATVPLFHLDETSGQWVQDGQATLKVTDAGSYYEGTVSHFSSWNADQEMDTIFVNGCVNDSTGKPAAWALVQASGIDYSGLSDDFTDTTGKFRVAIRKNSLAELQASLGDLHTPSLTVGPSATDITLSTCLVLADNSAPQVLTSPVDRTVLAGQFVMFRVGASGSTLRYQWQRNGVDLPGETYDTLSFAAQLADDGARYTCVVRNSLGQATSGAAVLHVNPVLLPVITSQPQSASALTGATVTFSATVTGSGPLTYQWQRNGSDITGATTASFTTPALTLADQGARYRLVVRNAYGIVTSSDAVLSVTSNTLAVPVIITQPAATTATAGQTASFSVQAGGNPAPTFQWLKNGTPISGATAAVYTTPVLASSDSGVQYSVRVSNSQGDVTSTAATLTVLNPANDAERANLMRLLGAASLWLEAIGAPLEIADDQGRVKASNAVCQTGSVSATLGGVAVTPGQSLPASGLLATQFTDCVDQGTRYTGSGRINYQLNGLSAPVNGSATVTLTSLRMVDTAGNTDYTVDGGGSVTLTGSVDAAGLTQGATLTPTAGSSILNNTLALKATLNGGSLVVGSTTRLSDGQPVSVRMSYSNFSFSVGSTPYIAQGDLTLGFGSTGLSSGTGSITLSSNGSVVGRLYVSNGALVIDVNGQVQPFGAKMAPAARR